MAYPLVSVIIPTKNRQTYAMKTVLQIVSLNQNIEIIIHDNSDDDSLYYMIKDFIDDGSVKYAYEKQALSFSDNYNKAAEMATGKFICAIGDDDGVLPNIVACAQWMEDNNIDIIKPAKDQVYFYPGNANRKKNACVGFGKYTGIYHYSNPEASVISLLNDGGCNYLEKDMPGSYHGLVRMDCMRKVKDITGKFYDGLTPDMFSVICLSLLPDISFVVIDYPITLPGVCPSSGSAASDSGKHAGRIEDAPHLKLLPDYKWSSDVPKVYSVETIWAETMVYAIQKMGRSELIDKYFNCRALAAYLYTNNEAYRRDILNVLDKDLSEYVVRSCRDFSHKDYRIVKYLENATVKISGKRRVIRNVQDICKAVDVFYNQIKKGADLAPWSNIITEGV